MLIPPFLGILLLCLMFIPNAMAEVDTEKITIIPKEVIVIEFEKYNIVRIDVEVKNDNPLAMGYGWKTFLAVGDSQSNFAAYEADSGYLGELDDVGGRTCPYTSMTLEPKSTEEFPLCFKVPKEPLDIYWIHLSDSGLDYCSEFPQYCQQENYMVPKSITPEYTNYKSYYQNNFIKPLSSISAELTDAGIREKDDLNVLHATFSITNKGFEEFNGPRDVHLENAKGQQFDSKYGFFSDCTGGTAINPGLTKSTTYCFEIPKNQYEFEVVVRHNFPWSDDCDNKNIGPDEQCEEERFNLEVGSSAVPSSTTSTTQQAGGGCGEGTVLINGVCQLSKDVDVSGQNFFNAVAGLILFGAFSIIAIIVIIIVIAILIRRRRKRPKKKPEFFKQDLKDVSKQTSGVQEDEIEKSATIKAQHLKEYEEYKKRLEKKAEFKKSTTIKRNQPGTISRIRNAFCENCGAQIKPTNKFCGKCGTRVNG